MILKDFLELIPKNQLLKLGYLNFKTELLIKNFVSKKLLDKKVVLIETETKTRTNLFNFEIKECYLFIELEDAF